MNSKRSISKLITTKMAKFTDKGRILKVQEKSNWLYTREGNVYKTIN